MRKFNKTDSHPYDHPHRRYNPLTGEWVLVSPQRSERPWLGKVETIPAAQLPAYDPDCYLCPGNQRAGGNRNPEYRHTFVFTNDFGALLPDSPTFKNNHSLLKSQSAHGTCRVICFSPRHDLTLPQMDLDDIRLVVDTWVEQVDELKREYRWVQVFENKGELMGCSNPHPHGQIWATDKLPNQPAMEDRHQQTYYKKQKSTLLIDYLDIEVKIGERVVLENPDWIVVVPYWAIWPFETLLIPRRHIHHLPNLEAHVRNSLADILKRLLSKYDNLFNVSFPYSMGWHGAPGGTTNISHWQLHAHFYPPLLRSATVKKFMVGYEMLAEAQRDLTPEQAAARLKNTPP